MSSLAKPWSWMTVILGLGLFCGCAEMTSGQPAVQPSSPPPPLPPEAQPLLDRVGAIRDVCREINATASQTAYGLADEALRILQVRQPGVEARLKPAEEKLAQAERALFIAMNNAGRPVTLMDCQGKHAVAFHDTCGMLDETAAILGACDQAVQLDGTPDATRVRQQIVSCGLSQAACMTAAKTLEAQSKVGALAGEAYLLVRGIAAEAAPATRGANMTRPLDLPTAENLAAAEDLAKQAKDEAQHAVDARAAAAAAAQQNAQQEKAAVDAAQNACSLNTSLCKTRCDSGDAAACEFWGTFNLKAGGNAAAGRTALAKACDTGSMPNACATVRGMDAMLQQAAAQVDGLWANLAEIADDLTQKVYAAEKLAQVANSPSRVRALETLRTVNQATVKEQLCPAKRAFVQAAGVADLQRRAAAHCRDQAPSGQGLSGAVVPLNSQCSAVFATACP